MAASLLMPVQPTVIVRASASTSGNQKSSDSQSQRKSSSWWTPLFGWSSEPDYIDTDKNRKSNNNTATSFSESDLDQRAALQVRSTRISPGKFTEEKARKLRMLTMEMESYHDPMYHSAIASRLASDFSDRSDL